MHRGVVRDVARVPSLRFGLNPKTPELWACSYVGESNLVYYQDHDGTGSTPGYRCVRVPRQAGVGNSEYIRLARALFKFTDGLPIP